MNLTFFFFYSYYGGFSRGYIADEAFCIVALAFFLALRSYARFKSSQFFTF